MALPLLPQEHIGPVLTAICRGRTDVPAIDQLVTYIRDTWVEGSVFSSTDISVYKQIVRTNNDVEGWHSRLNRRGVRANLQFYSLVDLLETESRLLSIQSNLVYREDVTRMQRHGAKNTTARLGRLWDSYAAGERSAQALLKAGSKLICPRIEGETV